MVFEKFTKKGRGLKPMASIRSSGQLGMNRGCIERFRLMSGFVALYYDAESKRIGIERGISEHDDGAHQLIVKPSNAFVGARAFLNWYGIPYEDKTRRYEISLSEDGRMLIVDLRKPIYSTREGRRTPRSPAEAEDQEAMRNQ